MPEQPRAKARPQHGLRGGVARVELLYGLNEIGFGPVISHDLVSALAARRRRRHRHRGSRLQFDRDKDTAYRAPSRNTFRHIRSEVK